MDIEKIAIGCLEYRNSDRSIAFDKLFSETVCVMYDLTKSDPETLYKIILKIVELTDDEWMLTLVGCGELEDLLAKHFEAFIDRVEAEAIANKKFAHAVTCLWQNGMTNKQYARLKKLINKLGGMR